MARTFQTSPDVSTDETNKGGMMAERNSSSSPTRDRTGGRAGGSQSAAGAAGKTSSAESATGGMTERLRDKASSQLNTQKDRATEGLGSVAQAVRASTKELREQHHDTIAGYVESAADQIERLSRGLRNRDVGELAREAQRFARRRPALFVGSAFAVGLVGARFFKSSAERGDYERGRGEYGYGGERAGGRSGPFAEGYRTDVAPASPAGTSGTAGTSGSVTTSGTSGSVTPSGSSGTSRSAGTGPSERDASVPPRERTTGRS